jgi:DNA polymerase III alpha subunit
VEKTALNASYELRSTVQLRIRTEFTFGETFCAIKDIIPRLKEINCRFAAIVDTGTWGHVQWDKACRDAGIVPMFGVQIAVVPDLESDDRPAMWFIARTAAGLKELYHFSTLANTQAVRGVARLSYEDVERMSNGIAKFAGAVMDVAFLKRIGAYADLDVSSPVANRKKKRMGIPLVAVSDNYYPRAQNKSVFEMIGKQSKPTPQHILSPDELIAELGLENFGVVEFTNAAAVAADVQLPVAPLIRLEGDLEKLCRDGIAFRFPNGWTAEYEERLVYELGMIRSKDFESYFLMVADMVVYAKTKMLVGPSRGSAAGSLVCYLIRITEVDPITSGLVFERFIDVTRKDLPDIDLDFVDSKRHLVIEYLREKYGAEHVAQIGTVSTYQAKSALVAIAKKLDIPPWETNAVKDAIFVRSSGDARANFALMDTLEQTDPGRKLLAKHPAIKIAGEIESHASHTGVHAAGILVCNEPIKNFCSVSADGVAQLDKKDTERLNLLKIDVLGLRTLGVLEDSGVDVDWYGMKYDDPATFQIFNDRKYAGIFQFEGQALQGIGGQMTVECLDDLGHITALARPGPMASGGATLYLQRRSGAIATTVPHPSVMPYVKDTYGVVIYQEQVLRICKELGRMNWDDVTLLRKAMSKTYGDEYFAQFKNKFVAGAMEGGVPKDAADAIWEMVSTMGSWAFNLAHSYSYAVVSYWTAWLKAHHLLEFSAATLRNAKDDESVVALLRELVKEGIEYIPFDHELSTEFWSVQNGKLVGGFTGLKGIGESKAKKLIEERAANGGTLPSKTLQKLSECEILYSDLFPAKNRWGDWYNNPEAHGLRRGSKIVEIKDIDGEGEFVYIGRLRDKDLGDYNEPIRIQRRNGKRYSGQTLFLDLKLEDDTGKILTRVDRFEFEAIGRKIWDEAPIDSWWLVRGERRLWGKADSGFKMIFVSKIMQLDV